MPGQFIYRANCGCCIGSAWTPQSHIHDGSEHVPRPQVVPKTVLVFGTCFSMGQFSGSSDVAVSRTLPLRTHTHTHKDPFQTAGLLGNNFTGQRRSQAREVGESLWNTSFRSEVTTPPARDGQKKDQLSWMVAAHDQVRGQIYTMS